jgi:CheY-like chemotaxis protein
MNVQDVVESSLLLMANEIRHHARLERRYDSVPAVLGNPAQLGQVFVNVLTNAVHAIGRGSALHNSIRVTTALNGDGKVMVTIADSGCGIAPETLGRIFDPFFSTKDVGAGMGLGLSISQRLVAEMGGIIRAESTLGQGSTFQVILPAQRDSSSARENPRTEPLQERPSILVIDDEPEICELLQGLLSRHFDVTVLRSSRAALEQLFVGRPFDLILCDLMMPDVTGMALYAELVRVRPELTGRFVFMTGGAFTTGARDFIASVEAPLLMKPFRSEILREVVFARLREQSARGRYH